LFHATVLQPANAGAVIEMECRRMRRRNRVARWLDPHTSRDADRYYYLIGKVSEAYRWLGDHEDAADLAQWLIESDNSHWRRLGEPSSMSLPHDIYDFREHLRRRRSAKAQQTDDRTNASTDSTSA